MPDVVLEKITRTSEYKRISKQCLKCYSNSFIMLYNKLDGESVKIGLTVSKRVGNAVVRNKCKRVLRALIRESKSFTKSAEIIIIAKQTMPQVSYSNLQSEFTNSLNRIM